MQQEAEANLERLIEIREKLFAQTFSNIQLKKMNLTDAQSIVQKEKKRLNINHQRISLADLQFQSIQRGNNLFNLVKEKKMKIINIQSDSLSIVKITIQSTQNLTWSLEAGTLFFPNNSIAQNTQTLILRDDIKAQIGKGQQNILQFRTLCYNQQLKSPKREAYLLGNIKCLQYKDKMNQRQVWEITVKKRIVLSELQQKYQKQDYIAFTKEKLHLLIDSWEQNN